MSSWRQTNLWQRLLTFSDIESETVRSFLSSKDGMEKIEIILNKGATSPKDFTLHDADHSFRVAQRIWNIIPQDTQDILSEYELAFLLLSAYLHDIGMTPEYKKVENHYLYLTTKKNKNLLSFTEAAQFQKWLDEEGEQIDLTKDALKNQGKAKELVTYYCRYKHNDWSEEWIRANLKSNDLGRYTNWLQDLINLCRSHHYNIDQLKTDKYNPIRIHGKVIHRRYLAMCLRLADVIEIDPERAPDVLIKHRDIAQASISYWFKEQFISVDIINNSVIITANPAEAYIHKAILDTANLIEIETYLCNILKSEMPLQNISPTNDLKHSWNILPGIYRDIKETGNYEFIDGTFRPNSRKILNILAGTELYGNPLFAIRELVQNAVDAIKVQLGYLIQVSNTVNNMLLELLQNNLHVRLEFYKEKDDYWISCRDNGIGMDKETIYRNFLVGGASKRHEILDLERKCKDLGYPLDLTAKFGIGAMSYFMIADKVIILSKKNSLSGNHEDMGWHFEINGLDDFGELQKINLNEGGTEIKLRLRKDLADQLNNWWRYKGVKNKLEIAVANIANEKFCKLPCRFSFHSPHYKFFFGPGWSKNTQYFKDELKETWNSKFLKDLSKSADFISEEEKKSIDETKNKVDKRLQDFERLIDFIICEGDFKNNNGFFRIHIPIYKNKRGCSFAYFFEQNNQDEFFLETIADGVFFIYNSDTLYLSWKGMAVDTIPSVGNDFPFKGCYLEMDIINEKSFKVSVSRSEIDFLDHFYDLLEEIKEKVVQELIKDDRGLGQGSYCLFNKNIAECLEIKETEQCWYNTSTFGKQLKKWSPIQFPVVLNSPWNTRENEIYEGKSVQILNELMPAGDDSYYTKIKFNSFSYKIDKVVLNPYTTHRISLLKTTPFNSKNNISFLGNTASFPPEWNQIICINIFNWNDRNDIGLGLVLNENFDLIQDIDKEAVKYIKDFYEKKTKLNSRQVNAILNNRARCVAFLLYIVHLAEKNNWMGLISSNKSFVISLWSKIFNESITKVAFYKYPDRLIYFSTETWEEFAGASNLPHVGREWKIFLQTENSEKNKD